MIFKQQYRKKENHFVNPPYYDWVGKKNSEIGGLPLAIFRVLQSQIWIELQILNYFTKFCRVM
jgi:hypothetical protein